MKPFLRRLLPLGTLTLLMPLNSVSAREFLVYFGTYTGAKSKGIYVSKFDTATGKLTEPELAAETKSPSFLAVHPTSNFCTRWAR
jgi:6-phosphogluconolactonase